MNKVYGNIITPEDVHLYQHYCLVCGGTLLGDGYTTVRHCENADVPMDVEPDAPIIYCEEV